jgi:site-specific DNA-adenine methylase
MNEFNRVKPPMSYQGGKQKVSSELASILDKEDACYVDLCCGSGAVSIALVNRGVPPSDITMVDASDWGEFWEQIAIGSFDLDLFEDMVYSVPTNPSDIKSYLESLSKESWDDSEELIDIIPTWILLQAGSFGGKQIWSEGGRFKNASFRDYWKPTLVSKRRSPVNPMMPMPLSLLENVRSCVYNMDSVKAVHARVEDFDWDYYERKVRNKENVVVYIDPPYEGTTGYGFKFDYCDYIKNLDLPDNYSLYLSDCVPRSNDYSLLGSTKKGGISGGNTRRNEYLSKIY